MFGLTKNGFKRMRYADIIAEMNVWAKNEFGQDVNVADNSSLGMIFKVVAFALSRVWEVAEATYYAGYKDTAEGFQLDGVGQYVGIKRKSADWATGIATFTGNAGTVIAQYFIIAAGTTQFWTTETVVIPESGIITAPIRCLETGEIGNVLPGTIATIVNPTMGVKTVTNQYATAGGSPVEPDNTFRPRYDKSISTGGSSTTSAIEAEVLAITEVIDCTATENTTMATVNGIPAKSVSTVVYGGADADIAQAIYKTKAGGMQAYGTTIVPITDAKGRVHQIGFTRVAEVPIYARIYLTTESEIFPLDGTAKIKDAIVSYIGGIDSSSVEHAGLSLGGDVIYTRIIGLCHVVEGVINAVVTLSTDNVTFAAANVAIDSGKKAVTTLDKIVIS